MTQHPVLLKEPTAGAKTPTTPEEFEVTLAALETYFAVASNVVVARHRFRKRAQLSGEPVEVFVAELRDQSPHGDFVLLTDEFIEDQQVAKTTRQQLRERLFLEGSGLITWTARCSSADGWRKRFGTQKNSYRPHRCTRWTLSLLQTAID